MRFAAEDQSPVITQLEAAPTDAERAQLLLRLTDDLVLRYGDELQHTCRREKFGAGVHYLQLRTTALHAVRTRAGELPAAAAMPLELWRRGLVAVAGGMAQ